MRKNVRDLIASDLTEREAKVIGLRFGLEDGNEYTLKATGQVIGVTRERVRQIQEKALNKLRQKDNIEKIVEYAADPKSARKRSKTYRLNYMMKNSSKKK